MTDPGFMERTVSAVSSFGANTPPMSAVVMTTSDWAHWSTSIWRCRAWSSGESSLGVAAAGGGAVLEVDADVLGADALDLLLDLGPHVAASTLAPSRRAVAMACSPATPAPITNTLAGVTMPAAVMNMGK